MNVLDFVLLALQSVAGLVDEKATAFGDKIGKKINGLVASTSTGFDDYAKNRVLAFLKAAVSAIESGAVEEADPV